MDAGDKDRGLGSSPLTVAAAVAWHKTSPLAAGERLGITAGARRGLGRSKAKLHFHQNLFTHRSDEIQTRELSRQWALELRGLQQRRLFETVAACGGKYSITNQLGVVLETKGIIHCSQNS